MLREQLKVQGPARVHDKLRRHLGGPLLRTPASSAPRRVWQS